MSVINIERFNHNRGKQKEVWMRVKDPAKIRRWRKQRHYSQRDLAFLVRRSQNTIYLLEAGKMPTLSEDLALAISARLDVPWEDLFDEETIKPMPKMESDTRTTRQSGRTAA